MPTCKKEMIFRSLPVVNWMCGYMIVFEKKMAAHLFTPPSSEHPVAVIRASINGFLKQSVPAACQQAAVELVVVAATILCETASHDT